MTGVDADLATLLMAARYYDGAANDPGARAAHGRVEAELSRLRELLDEAMQLSGDRRKWAEAAEARCARLQQALAPLDQFEYDLAYWQKAYPTSVFGEDLTDDEQRAVTQALESAGFTSDRVHASWARHITRSITEQYAPVKAARVALAGPDTPADNQPEETT